LKIIPSIKNFKKNGHSSRPSSLIYFSKIIFFFI